MAKLRVVGIPRRAAAGLLALLAGTGCDQVRSPVSSEESQALALDPAARPGCSALAGSRRIVIDASRDGGVWWFPQAGPFLQEAPHQGQALATYLRRRGFVVEELGRGTVLSDAVFRGVRAVIRTSAFGRYTAAELEAYRRFLACPATLVLLVDRAPGDQLADLLGLQFSGQGSGTISDFAPHQLTDGVAAFPLLGGTTLAAGYPGTVRILARFNGLPVMGVVLGQPARILFLGDVNGLEMVPRPFVDNLIAWGF